MNGNTYALIRVSTEDQNEARQVLAMSALGIPESNIIIEKESGKSSVRTKYHRLIKCLKAGDTLYLENIGRLSRDYDGILNEWHVLTEQKGVTIKVLDTPFLNTDQAETDLSARFMRDIFLLIQAFQAEYEWQKIKSRQAQGIAVAKANGKTFGRPKALITDKEVQIVRQFQSKEITLDTALKLINLKKSAFYKLCHALNHKE